MPAHEGKLASFKDGGASGVAQKLLKMLRVVRAISNFLLPFADPLTVVKVLLKTSLRNVFPVRPLGWFPRVSQN